VYLSPVDCSYSEQPGWAQPHEISTDPFASSQRWLQYFLSSGTVHMQAGWAHFFCSVSVMEKISFLTDYTRAPWRWRSRISELRQLSEY
jgi:hypothetical protein